MQLFALLFSLKKFRNIKIRASESLNLFFMSSICWRVCWSLRSFKCRAMIEMGKIYIKKINNKICNHFPYKNWISQTYDKKLINRWRREVSNWEIELYFKVMLKCYLNTSFIFYKQLRFVSSIKSVLHFLITLYYPESLF